MTDYFSYAVELRRQLHMYPEIGYDLDRTLALVKGELDKWDIPYTEEFCKSSIVATINEEKSNFTIGIRADMDALPIQEISEKPYRSRTDGVMHACGHDAHTAILLATGRRLQEMKDRINCRVKLLFTPAEEYIDPGCAHMANNGVMDEIDCIISLHMDKDYPAGTIALKSGGQGGNSMGFTVDFYGTTSHAAQQHLGKDAIMMAVEAINAMQIMVSHEIKPSEPRLLNIGFIHGGTTNNILCDHCQIFCSSRTHSDEVTQYILDRATQICQSIAACNGGRAELTVNKFLPYVINDELITRKVRESAVKVIGEDKILPPEPRGLGGEDFSFLSRKKPGMMFRLGRRNDSDPSTYTAGHNAKFDIDESSLQVGMDIFTQFVLDNMNGIEGL